MQYQGNIESATQAQRRIQLLKLVDYYGGHANLARRLGLASTSYVSQLPGVALQGAEIKLSYAKIEKLLTFVHRFGVVNGHVSEEFVRTAIELITPD